MPPREPNRDGASTTNTGNDGISPFSRMEFPRMPGFFDRAGSGHGSRKRRRRYCLPPSQQRQHPETMDFAAQ
jgi:hypothetical protein